MQTGKTSILTFCIAPAQKEALRTAVDREPRPIANMVEVLIRDYCGRNGIMIFEPTAQVHRCRQTTAGTTK